MHVCGGLEPLLRLQHLADEIDVLGPKPKPVVQAARDEILAVVLQLKEEGVVTLSLGGGNEMM